MGGAARLGVYVSVPFCRAKCSFCNFASGVGDGVAVERYVGRLCAEIAGARAAAGALDAELPERVDTVYLGGGTPSLLSAEQLERVFAALRREFVVEGDAEVTLEAAPGQIDAAVLEAAMVLGVNRVSLGVQTFVDRECAAVGRSHTGASCTEEIVRLRSAGMRVAADLIAGLPYQTAASWEVSLEAAMAAGLEHVSVYLLEVDAESRLGREVLGGGARLHAPAVPSDEVGAAMYERACGFLEERGVRQYEISNFAVAGQASRHNRKYWERMPYVGFGLDAHSMLLRGEQAVRFANGDELAGYGLPGSGGAAEVVGEREAFEEAVFLGLRLNEGVCLEGWRRDWVAGFAAMAREMMQEGLMWGDGGWWGLTLRGRVVSNEVFGRVLERVAA